MKATVRIRPKTEVLDPQGEAVRKALEKLGFVGVQSVRVGKLIEIEFAEGVHAEGRAELEQRLAHMSDTLLANPVMEDYEVDL